MSENKPFSVVEIKSLKLSDEQKSRITELLELYKEYRTELWLLTKKYGESEHIVRELWETEGRIKMLKELLEEED